MDEPASALLERIAELVRERNRIDAELAHTVRRAELAQAPEHDGLKSMASWLRGHCRLSPRAAGLLVRNGRALEHLPAVAAGCAEGWITADQLAVIAPITSPANLAMGKVKLPSPQNRSRIRSCGCGSSNWNACAIIFWLSVALTWIKSSGRNASSTFHCGSANASSGASGHSGATVSIPPDCR